LINTQTLRVPFHDFEARAQRWSKEWEESLISCVRDLDWVRPSRSISLFEEEFAAYCGVKHAIATASGSAALLLVMLTLGIRPNDEVVTVGSTFVATVSAIRLLGGKPILVDIERDSYTMDPSRVVETLSSRSKVLLPVHLFGRLAAVQDLYKIATSKGMVVVEEACQAVGAQRGLLRAGALGDAAVFSFGREKSIAGLGEGGAVVTNDDQLAHLLRCYCNQGRDGDDHVVIGSNFRIDPLQASILRAELRRADETLHEKRVIAACYNKAFAHLGIVHNPVVPPEETHGYYVYAIEVEDRSYFCKRLDAKGIGWRIHYPRPVHLYSAYKGIAVPNSLPTTEWLANHVVSIPLRSDMTENEVNMVIEAVSEALA